MSSTVRSFSIAEPNDPVGERRHSIAVEDASHLPKLEDYVAKDAAAATQAEVSMTLWEGLRLYPKAVGWSILLSTCIIMEGFDVVLITSLLALPAFRRRYGHELPDGKFRISASWQSGLSNGALAGEILGLFLVGILAERIGYRMTMISALVLITGFIFVVFFAESLPMLLAGEILMGIPWGAFQTLTTTYAAEVCPVVLRAYLTTYVNLCWVLGQFLSSGILKGVSSRSGSIGYKLPYGLQWMWPVPLIIGISLAPESPWWLVRKDRNEDARKQLLRLTSQGQPDFDLDQTINMMVYTNELEKASDEGTSYVHCFRGVDLRRTEIVCMVWAIQSLCGASTMIGLSTYFFEQAGLDTSHAFSLSLGQYGLGTVGALISWFLMLKFGRRTLYLWGQIAMVILLLIVGCLAIVPKSNTGAQWGIGATIIVYTFTYEATVGPVCYSLVAEISSTRLRNKTVVLARNAFNITSIIANILTTRMINPGAWNWGAKAGFFWAGSCLLCVVWTYFRLPEPKGRTYAEMDLLFDARVPASRFKGTIVESLEVAT